VEGAPIPIEKASAYLEAKKGGLKTGLYCKPRMAPLMLDETIITETPPLYNCYGHKGQPVEIPITGNRQKRILHGAMNILTGDVVLLETQEWVQETHQAFLQMVRSHWRGWNIVLFEDRGSPHTADESLEWAKTKGFEIRFLPVATPELNVMDHLWRHVKKGVLANTIWPSIDASIGAASHFILNMPPKERMKKAGILSPHFWLNRWPTHN
jgi:hypothetical protein